MQRSLQDMQDCLLGDFGAASFLPRHDAALATSLQRLEVRAFGCLLEELLDRCDTPHDKNLAALRQFQAQCLQPNVLLRPLFDEILREFNSLEHANEFI